MDRIYDIDDSGKIVTNITVRFPIAFFVENPPPPGHKGWTIDAIKEFCKEELIDAGFDLSRKVYARYDCVNKDVIYHQSPLAAE